MNKHKAQSVPSFISCYKQALLEQYADLKKAVAWCRGYRETLEEPEQAAQEKSRKWNEEYMKALKATRDSHTNE